MPSGPLPPKYVNAPSCILYSKEVSPVVRDTYLQLRGLAWNMGYRKTEPYLIKDLADLFGKSPDTIWQHMRVLSQFGWLRFNQAGYSAYIFSFPDDDQLSSLFPNFSGSVVNTSSDDIGESTESEEEQENSNKTQPRKRGNDDKKRDPSLDNEAVILYRGFAHLTANAYQRGLIVNNVKDIDLWKQTLEHWFGHGWRPMDVSRMIESYKQGGRAGCNLCNHVPANKAQPAEPTPEKFQKEAERYGYNGASQKAEPEKKVRPSVDPQVMETWLMLAQALRDNMQHPDYEAIVKPMQPTGWRGNTFFVKSADQDSCDWATSRLGKMASRMLSGIVGKDSTVQFVLEGV